MRPIEDEYNERKGKTMTADRYGFLNTNVNVDKEYEKYSINKK